MPVVMFVDLAVLSQAGWMSLAVVLLTLLEAFTTQIDNLILPVFAVALLNLAHRTALA
jgi:ABC-type uncharacterized transport system permease subunit